MGIMDMFRQAAPAAPTSLPEGAPPAMAGDAAAAGNPLVPAGTPATPAAGTPTPDANPLDTFKDLWTPAAADPNKPVPVADMFNIDPAAMQAAAAKVDFGRIVTPEMRQAMAAGGEASVNANIAALNTVAQSVYAQAASANTQILKQALAAQAAEFKAMMPGMVKAHTLSDTVRESNPALSHPAAQPLITAIQATLQAKHPNATNAELAKMAQDYVTGFANAVQPAAAPVAAAAPVPGADWSSYLD